MINAITRPLYSREKDPERTVQEAVGALGPGWTGADRDSIQGAIPTELSRPNLLLEAIRKQDQIPRIAFNCQ